MAVDLVQEIKLRTDLVELIAGYVPLRQAGRAHKGLCPFHAEKSPSFTVDGERGFFKCYGCGVGGDCFTFMEKKEGLDFQEAGEFLARRLGLEWVRRGDTTERRSERQRLYDVVALAERFFCQSLERAPEVREYLDRRGVQAETARDFRLGYAPPGYEALLGWLRSEKVPLEDAERADVVLRGEHGLRDRFVDRLMFPIYDIEGRPVAFGGRTLKAEGIPKYLNSRETPIFQKGRTLYGLHLAKRAIPGAGFTVAVEGYMDLIALHQAGVTNSVAGLGTAITETHVGVLGRWSRELVMCYDGDGAGIQAAIRNAAMFEAAGCQVRVAALPPGEDPDTYIKTHGVEHFRALLNRAEPLLDYQLSVIRARYNLSDETARLPFVREAARAIAQSGSHLTRQEYAARLTRSLDRLAEEWYPGDPLQARQARVALAHEIGRLLRTDRVAAGIGRGSRAAIPGPAVAQNGRSRAEGYVLRALLTEDRWAQSVAGRLAPEHFADPELAGIARRVLGDEGAGATGDIFSRVEHVRADPALAGTVSALVVQDTPLSEEGLEECLRTLEAAWKQGRRDELKQAMESGDLPPGDARGEEYRCLVAELGGRHRRRED